MFIKLNVHQAIDAIDKYRKDFFHEDAIWDHVGIRWTQDAAQGKYVKFKVINKERFLFVAMKYDLPIEVIENL
jgi:hypothetical protein